VSELTLGAPVAAALLLSGLALDRMAIAIAGSLVLAIGMAANQRPGLTRARSWGVAIAGGLIGSLMLLVGDTPHGPVPPLILSPAAGALAAIAIGATLTRRLTVAWGTAGVLVIVAVSMNSAADLVMPGAALAGVTALSVLLRSGPLGPLRIALFALGVSAAGAGGGALARLQTSSEGWLLLVFEAALQGNVFATGLGLQSEISLASYSSVQLSDQAILDVDGATPEYLRGQVMDVFDGTGWSASEQIGRPRDAPTTSEDSEDSVAFTLTMLSSMRDVVPLPAGTANFQGETPTFTDGWLVSGSPWRGEVLEATRAPDELLPVESARIYDSAPNSSVLDEAGLGALLALPADLAVALAPLVGEIIGDADTPMDKARAIERHFITAHTYSLKSDLRGEGHPLVILITERRPAYCVYFASAMAALLRVERIPSRVVGGFALPPPNRLTGRVLVRKRDAHAWVEAWSTEARRWIAYDPTPYREAVLSADRGNALLEAVRDAARRLFVRLRAQPAAVLADVVLSWPFGVLVIGGVGWSIWLRLRGGAPRRRRVGRAPIDRALWPHYRRYLRLLNRRGGIRPEAWQSDEEILGLLRESASAEVIEAAEGFISVYRQARYRGQRDDDALRSSLRRLKAAWRAGR